MRVRLKRPPALLLPVIAALLFAACPRAALGSGKGSPKPLVMLLIDTSGSMEYSIDSATLEGEWPICHAARVDGFTYHKSRWVVAAEVLTGSFYDYWCSYDYRDDDPTREDYLYSIPHVVFHGLEVEGAIQRTDGFLDLYRDSVKFGLMTFDPRAAIDADQAGAFSYGPNKAFSGGLLTNLGARNAAAPWGALIGPPKEDGLDAVREANSEIQEQILMAMPYGGTPISPMLDDALYFFKNDERVRPWDEDSGSGDPYSECRSRNIILITDGQPNLGEGVVGYATSQAAATKLLAEGVSVYVVGFQMPDGTFPILDKIAKAGGTEAAYIVANQSELVSTLGEILVDIGGTQPSRAATVTTMRTLNVKDRQYQFNAAFSGTCQSPLDQVGQLDQLIFRCDPECCRDDGLEGEGGACPDDYLLDVANEVGLCEVFSVSDALNARTCDRKILTQLDGQFEEFTVANSDVDTNILAIPKDGDLPQLEPEVLPSGQVVYSGLIIGDAKKGWVREEYREQLIGLVAGLAGSRRQNIKMGAIYHSEPVLQTNLFSVTAPIPSFIRYRNREDIRERPTVLFVGTHDAQLHAFQVDRGCNVFEQDYGKELWSFIPKHLLGQLNRLASGTSYLMDGTPVVQEVRLYKKKVLTVEEDEAELWRSVLVSGYREGGRGYFALDVTHPDEPAFMWEIMPAERCANVPGAAPSCVESEDFRRLGYSYGRAAVGAIFRKHLGAFEERAVAIFGGGKPIPAETDPLCNCTQDKIAIWHKLGGGQPPKQLCVKPQALDAHLKHGDTIIPCSGGSSDPDGSGKALYVVDLESGLVIREFCNDCGNVLDDSFLQGGVAGLDCALIGDVAAHDVSIGATMTRAFIGDECGQIWRLDLANPDPDEWRLSLFHDAFAPLALDDPARRGIALTPALVISESRGRLVVLYGTGDPDELLAAGQADRVFSVQEEWDNEAKRFAAAVNWQLELEPGEVFTSVPVVYASVAYFTTQAAGEGLCNTGFGRLWGVDYDGTCPLALDDVEPALDEDGCPSTTVCVKYQEFEDSELVGVQVTQRPTCFENVGNAQPWKSGFTGGANAPPVGSTFVGGPATGAQFSSVTGASQPELVVQTGATGASTPGMQPPQGGGQLKTGNKAALAIGQPPKTLFSTSWGMIFD